MNIPIEGKLASVADSLPKQARDTEALSAWVERAVWTERMLKTLVTGVKGGKWFSLIDKVFAKRNLYAAFKKVARNRGSAGVDHVSVERFASNLDQEVEKLHQELKHGTYQPQAIKRVYIPKPGSAEKRPLGVPTVRDRVVQTALRAVLEPIFEIGFAANSYGFRPGKGCKDALRHVDRLLKKGLRWVVDLDFKAYFDTIAHAPLANLVGEKVCDMRVLELLKKYLAQEVMDEMSTWSPEAGTPQGAIISPLLSNVYLNPLDHLMEQRGWHMVRYADDAVVLCATEEDARRALAEIRLWSEQAQLTLHPVKTKIVDILSPGGFDFLGYHFEVSRKRFPKINRWPRKKSMKKLRDKLRPMTKRANGLSLETIIKRINPSLRGWFEYFKHSLPNTFADVDAWVRMRLRSILRKRLGGRGRGRGADHKRWPNAYFHELGLFSTVTAHSSVTQSSRR